METEREERPEGEGGDGEVEGAGEEEGGTAALIFSPT